MGDKRLMYAGIAGTVVAGAYYSPNYAVNVAWDERCGNDYYDDNVQAWLVDFLVKIDDRDDFEFDI